MNRPEPTTFAETLRSSAAAAGQMLWIALGVSACIVCPILCIRSSRAARTEPSGRGAEDSIAAHQITARAA